MSVHQFQSQASVSDAAYGAGWNGDGTTAPSKNSVYDQIEAMVSAYTALVSDSAYDATAWNGVGGVAPSKNAVRDQIEALDAAKQNLAANLTALAGLTSAADKLPYFTGAGTAGVTDFSSVARTLVNQTTQSLMRTTGLGCGTVATLDSDTDGTLAANSDTKVATQKATKTYADTIAAAKVSDLAYNVTTWNGVTDVAPSQNAVRDKFASLAASDLTNGTISGDGGGFIVLAGALSGTGSQVCQNSPTIATPTISGAILFPDGVRQTFNPDGTTPGLNFGSQAGDPSTPSNGDVWYDSTAGKLRGRQGGSSVDLGGGGGVPTTITVANEASDTTCFPLFATAATGDLGPKTSTAFKYDSTSGNLESTKFNKVAITAPATGATLTLADGSTLATSGANSLTLTTTGTTNATFPSGTVTLAQLAANTFTGDQTISTGAAAGYFLAKNTNAPTGLRVGVQSGGGSQIMHLDDFDLNLGCNAIGQFVVKKSGNAVIGGSNTVGSSATCNLVLGGSLASPSTSPVLGAAGTDMCSFAAIDVATADRITFGMTESGKKERIHGCGCRISSDVVVAMSTTLTNLTGLSFNVIAGEKIAFQAVLFTTSSSSGGVKVAIGGTCSATSIRAEAHVREPNATPAIGTTRVTSMASAFGDVTAVTAACIIIHGFIDVNAAGTLTIQGAQNASHATPTTFLAGSHFRLLPIGS